MCAQVRQDSSTSHIPDLAEDSPLGIPPDQAQIALQQDCVKELVNKLAWALGSFYRSSYSNMRTPTRAYAWRIVQRVLRDHGYPEKIKK